MIWWWGRWGCPCFTACQNYRLNPHPRGRAGRMLQRAVKCANGFNQLPWMAQREYNNVSFGWLSARTERAKYKTTSLCVCVSFYCITHSKLHHQQGFPLLKNVWKRVKSPLCLALLMNPNLWGDSRVSVHCIIAKQAASCHWMGTMLSE